MTDQPDPDVPVARHANGRFGPGNPGRPVGAHNRISRRIAMRILADFEANDAEVLSWMRRWKIERYFATVVSMLPKATGADLVVASELEDDAVESLHRQAIDAVNATADRRQALHRLEALLTVAAGGASPTGDR